MAQSIQRGTAFAKTTRPVIGRQCVRVSAVSHVIAIIPLACRPDVCRTRGDRTDGPEVRGMDGIVANTTQVFQSTADMQVVFGAVGECAGARSLHRRAHLILTGRVRPAWTVGAGQAAALIPGDAGRRADQCLALIVELKTPARESGTQSPAAHSACAIALPRSSVLALPPMSAVRGAPLPGSSTFSMVLTICPPAST